MANRIRTEIRLEPVFIQKSAAELNAGPSLNSSSPPSSENRIQTKTDGCPLGLSLVESNHVPGHWPLIGLGSGKERERLLLLDLKMFQQFFAVKTFNFLLKISPIEEYLILLMPGWLLQDLYYVCYCGL